MVAHTNTPLSSLCYFWNDNTLFELNQKGEAAWVDHALVWSKPPYKVTRECARLL